MGEERPPFLLREITPFGPAGFPPDVAPNGIIFASHINAIRDSVGLWPGHVNAQGHNLAGVAAITAGAASIATAVGVAAKLNLVQATIGSWDIQIPASVNALTFGQGGSEKARITAAGDLGIATNAPIGKLEVAGFETYAYFRSNGSGNPPATFTNGIALGWNRSGGAAEGNVVFCGPLLDIGAWSGAGAIYTSVAVLTATGNLGVGVVPVLPLHVKRDASDPPAITGTAQVGGTMRLQAFNVGLDFGVYDSAVWWMQAYGSVGTDLSAPQHIAIQPRFGNVAIGKEVAGYKLDVTGDINVVGNYRKNGTIIPGGLGLTRQVIATEERALGATYQNTGDEAMLVSVAVSGVGQATARTDEADPPAAAVASAAHMLFVVLPGNYYRITVEQPDVALASWVEWT